MAKCCNTALKAGHLGGKQSKDKTLKTLIPLSVLQGRVKCTRQMFSNLVPLGEFAEPYTLVKS